MLSALVIGPQLESSTRHILQMRVVAHQRQSETYCTAVSQFRGGITFKDIAHTGVALRGPERQTRLSCCTAKESLLTNRNNPHTVMHMHFLAGKL